MLWHPRLFDTGADSAELHSLADAAGEADRGKPPGEQPLRVITYVRVISTHRRQTRQIQIQIQILIQILCRLAHIIYL